MILNSFDFKNIAALFEMRRVHPGEDILNYLRKLKHKKDRMNFSSPKT